MKYIGLPSAVWQFFCRSFEKNLPAFFGITKADAKFIMGRAKGKYKEIIGSLPDFEKDDRFRMNIVGCAMLAAVILNMPSRPDVEKTDGLLPPIYDDSTDEMVLPHERQAEIHVERH